MLYAINTVIFLFLALCWGRDNWANFLVKLMFITLFIINLVATIYASGYIVKIG